MPSLRFRIARASLLLPTLVVGVLLLTGSPNATPVWFWIAEVVAVIVVGIACVRAARKMEPETTTEGSQDYHYRIISVDSSTERRPIVLAEDAEPPPRITITAVPSRFSRLLSFLRITPRHSNRVAYYRVYRETVSGKNQDKDRDPNKGAVSVRKRLAPRRNHA